MGSHISRLVDQRDTQHTSTPGELVASRFRFVCNNFLELTLYFCCHNNHKKKNVWAGASIRLTKNLRCYPDHPRSRHEAHNLFMTLLWILRGMRYRQKECDESIQQVQFQRFLDNATVSLRGLRLCQDLSFRNLHSSALTGGSL